MAGRKESVERSELESPLNRKEVLPAGNVWRFSENNEWLNPKIFLPNECVNLTQTTKPMQKLVAEIQKVCVRDDWEFASVLEQPTDTDSYFNEDKTKTIAVVFTNPSRRALVKDHESELLLPDHFLKNTGGMTRKEMRKQHLSDWYLGDVIIEKSLRGTSYMIKRLNAGYNYRKVNGLTLNPFTKVEQKLYQTGVAYVSVDLCPIESIIKKMDTEIEEKTKEFTKTITPLQAKKKIWESRLSSRPQPLFLTK